MPPVLDALSKDISIHALLAESDTSLVVIGTNCVISIHALLAESDYYGQTNYSRVYTQISIHALLAESDYTPRLSRVVPTPNFYPRSPCG